MLSKYDNWLLSFGSGTGSDEAWCPECDATVEVATYTELGYTTWDPEECPECGHDLEPRP